jgi:hypothetical protein
MRHLTSTIQQFDLQPAQLPTRDRAATEGRAWLLRRLRWEHRLAELRSLTHSSCPDGESTCTPNRNFPTRPHARTTHSQSPAVYTRSTERRHGSAVMARLAALIGRHSVRAIGARRSSADRQFWRGTGRPEQ